jgi:flagellar basal body-associated protein FliL
MVMLPATAFSDQNMSAKFMIPSIFCYIEFAVCFIWLGIGSFLARRWAWALTVILSWLWFIVGIAMIIPIGFVMSKSMENSQQVKMSSSSILVIQLISGTMLFGIYILLPALFLLFYNRASVRSTCQQRDQKVRWTDRCPMPVLAISVIMAYSAFSMPMTWSYNFVICLFGVFISGVWGAVFSVLMMTLFICLAFGTYKLKKTAWWGTLLLWLAGIINLFVTFSSGNLMEMYEKMGYSEQQMEMIRKVWGAGGISIMWIWMVAIFGVAALGYMLYVRRYFVYNTHDVYGQ